MNFNLKDLPNRTEKPRSAGITMVMDKGLSIPEVENFLAVSGHLVDVVKLGFGTSVVTPNLKEKLAVYKSAGIPTYFGGTLFEAFAVREQFEDYCRILDEYQMEYVEVSNGTMDMTAEEKAYYISTLAKNFRVLSEVGSKDSAKILAPYVWVEWMNAELEAGAWKVIAEARESGTVGVFDQAGSAKQGLVDEIVHSVPQEKILWEAPQKSQQVFFIKKFGSNVNLGNIAPKELIPLETLRLGLRGDTFFSFLGK